ADMLPEISEQEPISRPNDLWQLDRHRVICASALEEGAYATLMQGEKAAMMFSDVPYNTPIDGHASGNGKIRHRDFAMAAGEMTKAEFTQFLLDTATLATRHSVSGAIHFICMDWRHIGEVSQVAERVYTEVKNLCVWTKHNAGMGSFYRSQHELIFVLKHGRGRHRNNIE